GGPTVGGPTVGGPTVGGPTVGGPTAGGPTAAGGLLVPPRRWAARGVEAAALLDTATQLVAGGFAAPRDLSPPLGGQPTVATTIGSPAHAGAEEVAHSVAASVTTVRNQLRDMDDATDRDPRRNTDPASLLDPLVYNLLRAMSSAWRGGGGESRDAA